MGWRPIALVLVLVLAALPAQAAPSGAQAVSTLPITPLEVAFDDTNGVLLIGGQDNGGDSWYLLDQQASRVRQEGNLRAPGCVVSCARDARAVDLDGAGNRFAILSGTGSSTTLHVGTLLQGLQASTFTIEGEAFAVHVAEDGSYIYVLTQRSTLAGPIVRIATFAWSTSGTVSTGFTTDVAGTVRESVISPTALALVVNDGHVRVQGRTSPVIRDDSGIAGGARALDMAMDPTSRSVLVSGSGWLQVYEKDTPDGQRDLKFKRSTVGIEDVAIHDTGSTIATIDDNHVLRIDNYNPATRSVTNLLQATVANAEHVQFVTLSGREYLLAYGDSTITYYSLVGSQWLQVLSHAVNGANAIGASASGTLLVQAANRLQPFEAVEDVSVDATLGSVVVGGVSTMVLNLSNNGNRVATGEVNLTGPSDWLLPPPRVVSIEPDAFLQVPVAYEIPRTFGPGVVPLQLDGVVASVINVTVPVRNAWAAEASFPSAASVPATIGQAMAFTINVTNLGNDAATPDVTLTETQDWGTTVEGPGALAPQTSGNVTVLITPPNAAGSGETNQITVRVEGIEVELPDLVVGARYAVSITGPNIIEARVLESAKATLTIRNTGNANDVYRVQATEQPAGWSIIAPQMVTVAAGGQEQVEITVRPQQSSLVTAPPSLYRFEVKSQGDPAQVAALNLRLQALEPAVVDDPDDNEAPLGLVVPLAALGAAAWVARRRS